jgi:hypothetical protein
VTIAKKRTAFYYAKQSWEKRSFFLINSLKEYLEPLGQFEPNFGGMVLGCPPSKLCPVIPTSNKDGRQAKNRKKRDAIIKIFSSETTEPISTKLC